jgi:hypothetical protein
MAPLFLLVLVLAGTGCAVGGVFLLAGAGWSLLVGGAFAFALAAVVLRGIRGASGVKRG